MPPRPLRIELSFAPDFGAWPRHPTVLINQALRIYLRAFDVTGELLDPASIGGVVFRVQRPAGPMIEATAALGDGIALYSIGVANDVAGLWRAEAECTAPSLAAAEISWRVQPRQIVRDPLAFVGWALMADDGWLLATDLGELLVAA